MTKTKYVWDHRNSCEALVLPRRGVFNYNALVAADGGPASFARETNRTSMDAVYLGNATSSDIMSASWHKDTESPTGVFHLQLKPHNTSNGSLMPYMERIGVGDLIFIFMDNHKLWSRDNQLSGKLETIGIIDRVSKSISVGEDGRPSESVAVSGCDIGAMFLRTSMVFDQALNVLEQIFFTEAYFQRLNEQSALALSPLENVLTIIDLVYNGAATNSALVTAQWRFNAVDQGEIVTPADNDAFNGSVRQVPVISMLDISTFTQGHMFGYTLPDPFSFAQAGNAWALMDSYCNRVVNEMFIDIRDYTNDEVRFVSWASKRAEEALDPQDAQRQTTLRARIAESSTFLQRDRGFPSQSPTPTLALVMRQRPYDIDAFMQLPQVNVEMTEVISAEMGYSSENVFNFFRIRSPVVSAVDQELIHGIRVNVDSVGRFGLRRMEPETRYFFSSSALSSGYAKGESHGLDFSDMFDFYVGLLSTWNAANDQMLEGQMTLHFRPDIRIGTRLRLRIDTQRDLRRLGVVTGQAPCLDFYVQAVNQSFSASPDGSRTTVTLVRGIDPFAATTASNLKWTRNGSAIPPEYNTFVSMNAFGRVVPESEVAARVLADLNGVAYDDIEID